jgi:hypothetical protein
MYSNPGTAVDSSTKQPIQVFSILEYMVQQTNGTKTGNGIIPGIIILPYGYVEVSNWTQQESFSHLIRIRQAKLSDTDWIIKLTIIISQKM